MPGAATILLLSVGVCALGALAWGWFEAGWVRLESEEVLLPGLPDGLDGVRIVHLADLHLGVPSRGRRAVERAVSWTEACEPDLVLISGDLLSRKRGEPRLRSLIGRLDGCYAVLGNHDFALGRDPFSQPSAVFEIPPARLLLDEQVTIELRGFCLQIVGVDPRSFAARTARPERLADPAADLRILLCHFPDVVDNLPAGSFDLVLSGHLHDGQICIPYPGGKLRLSHPSRRFGRGFRRTPGGLLHLSAGLGTTFVPFRFFSRPEASELVLRAESRLDARVLRP